MAAVAVMFVRLDGCAVMTGGGTTVKVAMELVKLPRSLIICTVYLPDWLL